MENYRKLLIKSGSLYFIFLAVINYVGFLLPSSGALLNFNAENIDVWVSFMNTYKTLINILSIFSFVIPTCLCALYIFSCKPEKVVVRLVNLPFAYSLIAISGWVFSFFCDAFGLVCTRIVTGANVNGILFSSFCNIFQECLFIFTLGFLVMYTVHRKYVLSKFLMNEDVLQDKKIHKTSISFLFVVFYISVGIFPIYFLSSSLISQSLAHNFAVEKSIYIVVLFLLFFGVLMVIIFSNFFSFPLEKLKEGAKRIQEGDYSKKVNVVSTDDFGDLTATFNGMTSALNEKTEKIYAIQQSIIRSMAVMVESRDNSTGGHINRTSDCVKIFSNKLKTLPEFNNLSEDFYIAMIKAAPMHDLGKIAVDDAILRKPGKFLPEEYEIMKKHSAEGARIVDIVLKDVDDEVFKQIAVNVAHYHHEKWDGSGYPKGLKGEEIPFEARIMALADVFDALVSKRCYKDSFSYDKAFAIIEDSLGSHFDPSLGRVFVSCRNELESLYNSY